MESRDLGLLVTLDALLQEGNVTLAARRLGLSTPATSHALARMRTRLGDPLLVRAGRSMALTPRAEQLRPLVRSLVEDAQRVLAPPGPFSPRTLRRTFTIFATDQVLLVLGPAIDRLVRGEAPDVSLRFLPSVADDWVAVRDGSADLSVCLPGAFPPEFRTRPLLTERFVCVFRADHPRIGRRLTLDTYLALDHIVVAPLGKPSHVDSVLAERGQQRRIACVVPYFASALHLTGVTDYVLTVSESAARAVAGRLSLRIVEPPLALPSYSVNLLWHPRLDNEPASQWLRDVFVRAASATRPDSRSAADTGPAPTTRPRQVARPTGVGSGIPSSTRGQPRQH
jgi:DNA-binding transcriptional LysR family regulator